MKSMFQEFKSFAVKGNMVDLAVGIIIGTAFNNVVTTIVKKVAMPPLSLMTDGVNLSNMRWVLRDGSTGANGESISEEIAVGYGELIEVSVDFLIIALTVFLVIKAMNSLKRKAEDPMDKEVETPKNIELLSNIEKLIKEQNSILESKK